MKQEEAKRLINEKIAELVSEDNEHIKVKIPKDIYKSFMPQKWLPKSDTIITIYKTKSQNLL